MAVTASTVAFLTLRPIPSNVESGVWVSGIRVSQLEAAQILAATEPNSSTLKDTKLPDAASSNLTNYRFSLFRNNLSPKVIELLPSTPSITLQGALQDSGQETYILKATAGQRLTVMPQGKGVKITLLQPNHRHLATIVSNSYQWTGHLAEPGDYLLQVEGSGMYSLVVSLGSAS